MALAALYSTARRSNRLLPEPHGFIVDHKARPESTEEAEWVAEQLRQKCMPHVQSILTPDINLIQFTWTPRSSP
jgi:hypothetical protein